MLLKLVMPYIDHRIQGGTIIQWHKKEGDRVHYGDDLFEMYGTDSLIGSYKLQTLGGPGGNLTEEQALARDLFLNPSLECFIRITSSDMAVLRKICIGKGERGDVAATVALLTTEEEEAINESDDSLNRAATFRVVANLIE